MNPRVLAVTAGAAGKRNPVCAALADLYNAEVLLGKARAETRADKLWRKLGVAEHIGTHASNIRTLNREILKRDFDVLFVVKGNFVTAATLRALKTRPKPPRIIGWSPDDIYLRHNNSAILRAAAPFYDTFYTAKSLNITQGELAAMGFADPRYLQQGYDRDWHRPVPDAGSRFAGMVSFVGFGEEDRFNKMNHLAKNGIPVHIWGHGWTRAMRSCADENLHIHDRGLFGDDYADALCNSAVSLCFLRKLNRDLHTSRTFEIPACGGFMVAERTNEHLGFFDDDREAVFFDDEAELLAVVSRYLGDPKARGQIAAAGRQRCLDSDYSYHRLARDMITAALTSHIVGIPAHM